MAMNTGGAGGQEILELLQPRWESGQEGRTGTHMTFECPLCGPRGGRVSIPLIVPLDGQPPLDAESPGLRNILINQVSSTRLGETYKTRWEGGALPWWGKIGFDRAVACPAGHKLIVEGGMVRQRRHNEGD